MGEIRQLRPVDPAITEQVTKNMHELVELGLVVYPGDGSNTYLMTERLVHLFPSLLAFVQLFAADLGRNPEVPQCEYHADAWDEVAIEVGMIRDLWDAPNRHPSA